MTENYYFASATIHLTFFNGLIDKRNYFFHAFGFCQVYIKS